MRPRFFVSTPALLLTLSAVTIAQTTMTAAPAVTLKVGDAAPPLTVSQWIKGDPVARFEPGKTYVLDFWATWCVPCRMAMPHLTDLVKQYPDIVFIGQNISEDDVDGVKPFLNEMGDKIGFRVALDDTRTNPAGAMAAGWMEAAGVETIPLTFIVDQAGKIAWIGHPMELDPVLKQIKAGTFDAQATAARQAKIVAMNEKLKSAVMARDVDGRAGDHERTRRRFAGRCRRPGGVRI